MQKTSAILLLLFVLFTNKISAQDTLPHVSVKEMSGRVIISWKNNYGARINTINIQRSSDSVRNFTSIGSVLDPLNKENGFVDNKAPDNKMYYRVFIAFAGGRFIFSKSQKPVKDTSNNVNIYLPNINEELGKTVTPKGYFPSRFVFTGKENNVVINLPDALTKKYSLKFFDEKDNPVFEIHKITESYLIIEKVNFIHAGWFNFQLFENGILQEKHKLFIPKDGKNAASTPEQKN